MAKVDWNAGEYEARAGFELVPKGRYLTIISSTERKNTKAKDGKYDEYEFIVLKPADFKNRKLWARLNVENPSDDATRIGREQFNALCLASGLDSAKVKDTDLLIDKIQVSIVDIEEGTRGPMNRVTGWLKPSDNDQKFGATAAKDIKKGGGSKPADKGSDKGGSAKRQPAKPVDDMDDDIPF